jgi:transcriptional regulator with GAF, ATPase, and Fis domain
MSTMMVPSTNVRSVLIASGNCEFRQHALERLSSCEWRVDVALGGAEALGKMESSPSRLLLLDRRLPDLQPSDVVEMIEARHPGVDVVLVNTQTGQVQMPSAVTNSTVYEVLQALEIKDTRAQKKPGMNGREAMTHLPGVVGSSDVMRRLARLVGLVAQRNTTVLITGETGTGKELIAEAVHKLSPRAVKPFVIVNCAAIPESLLEAELFGHTKGAFTGALQSRVGKIHSAQGGTIFLDEIGEMIPAMQAKLLRFLENSEVQRLGCSDVFKVDVRVVAATNCRLLEMVKRGEFRQDLYYRLSVFPIEMPPLRERGSDIEELAVHFAKIFAGECRISSQAESILLSHSWPGNVRELKHVIERAVILGEGTAEIQPEHVSICSIGENPACM